MLKKFFATLVLMILLAAPASAANLSLNPQPVAKIACDNNYNLQIELDKYKIELSPRVKGDNFTGAIAFDKNFYCHLDTSKRFANFGGSNIVNTVKIDLRGKNEFMDARNEIYRIENSDGDGFFLIKKTTDAEIFIKVLGIQNERWVECIDTLELQKRYSIANHFTLNKFSAADDKIIFVYKFQNQTVELACRWNADNQKFSPEVIKR